jgi:hypothetical protein
VERLIYFMTTELLNTILTHTHTLLSASLSEDRRQDVESIRQSAERLQVLLNTPETPLRLYCDCANAIVGYSHALLTLPYLYERGSLMTSSQRAHLLAIKQAGEALKSSFTAAV